MMPDGDRFHMVNGANWFDRTVSADACGIILTSLVINRQLWLYHDSGDAGQAVEAACQPARKRKAVDVRPRSQSLSLNNSQKR
uniref:Antirestriction protein klcA n=1 Tax=Escherichia coli TaxID=562 RepID=A0A7U1E1T4_ECOLX|nr:Antirestriction protein klcA [Escherichia coli]